MTGVPTAGAKSLDPCVSVLLQKLPPIDYGFAYGSGAFYQPGLYESGANSPSGVPAQPMLDFIFAVEHPVTWHRSNMAANPSHYSCLRLCGPRAANWTAHSLGAGLYYNTLVPIESRLVKYGVMSTSDLIADLERWRWLYAAGRLHKPVAELQPHAGVRRKRAQSLRAALGAARLTLPARFDTRELLTAVCALSYRGDLRMGVAEDASKVQRIVEGSRAGLEELYAPGLAWARETGGLVALGEEAWAQDCSPAATAELVSALPSAVLARMPRSCTQADRPRAEIAAHLDRVLRGIVRASSLRQMAAGFLGAGACKSARYAAAKVAKALR
ncbi:mitochondrial matrix protein Mmp37 [Helicosporidium sp. ATCC 50920]|nr:mitochondrial matrix protein Mmp37 [Helicosporidium sp. ATCC 50920]|eukprot:KDD75731.1 mitochondrial matrix protein Mmp37 [Helicosporidium sp. ATCC 50920]